MGSNNVTQYKFVAAIFGLTGLVGTELARKLLSSSQWKVYGIARRPNDGPRAIEMERDPNYHYVSCDLLSCDETHEKLSVMEDLTHVFWITWATQFPLDSLECSEQNKAMMSNALNVVLPRAKALRHVSLQTGMKHYVSLQGNWAIKEDNGFLFHEDSPRVVTNSAHNFYYALEDLLHERLPHYKVAWSIHRPGLIIGCSRRTLYNFLGTLCVYGTICKYLNLPFVFGGTKKNWEEMCLDVSDARLVSEQHIWAATKVEYGANNGVGQAFNSVNGVNYTWKDIWGAIGIKLGVHVSEENMFSEDFAYSFTMGDKGSIWDEIVAKEGLVETKMEDLANWGFLDMLFRCPVKMLGTRDKADNLGFKTRYHVLDTIFYWIDAMRSEKLIP